MDLITARAWRAAARPSAALERAERAGGLVRVHSGVYVDRDVWLAGSDEERLMARMRAVALRALVPPVFSHESAALLLGAPHVGRTDARVHVTLERASGGRTSAGVVRHVLSIPGIRFVEVDGLRCTDPTATLLDLARTRSFPSAVVAADDLVRRRGAELDLAHELLAAAGVVRGRVPAQAVLEFADGRAETPIESLSRVGFRLAGLPAPELQVRFVDAHGFVARVDFWWRHLRLIGEADGRMKYLDFASRGGRSAAEVVYDEKRREDASGRSTRGSRDGTGRSRRPRSGWPRTSAPSGSSRSVILHTHRDASRSEVRVQDLGAGAGASGRTGGRRRAGRPAAAVTS